MRISVLYEKTQQQQAITLHIYQKNSVRTRLISMKNIKIERLIFLQLIKTLWCFSDVGIRLRLR